MIDLHLIKNYHKINQNYIILRNKVSMNAELVLANKCYKLFWHEIKLE